MLATLPEHLSSPFPHLESKVYMLYSCQQASCHHAVLCKMLGYIPCDNKSASHWIMFDFFFSCLKSKHFFLFKYVPRLFLLTCVKFHGKKFDNNDTLTHICILPFFPNGIVLRHIRPVNKSRDFVIGQPNLKSKSD